MKKNIESKDGLTKSSSEIGCDILPINSGQILKLLSKEEQIEANKDKLDLKPNIDFVSNNISIYEASLKSILESDPDEEAEKWSKEIKFNNVKIIPDNQISPEDCQKLLSRMPKPLIELSKLKNVDYIFANTIPIPHFDESGNLDKSNVDMVKIDEFPRSGDHLSRILIGYSTGTDIYPSAIPKTVSEDAKACYIYQIHVFLHEFFHTVEFLRRNADERSKIILELDGKKFTLEDWWSDFEKLVLSGREPICVSSYANTYFEKLNINTKENNNDTFTDALGENICETFVAYMLNIISNNDGWTDFRAQSFGNQKQLSKFIKGEVSAANEKWGLMDKLCQSSIITK